MLTIGLNELKDFERISTLLGDSIVYYKEKPAHPLLECELLTIDRKARVKYTYFASQGREVENDSDAVKQIREAAKRLKAFKCCYFDDSVLTYTPEQ